MASSDLHYSGSLAHAQPADVVWDGPPPPGLLRIIADRLLPWLFSTTVHAGLVALLLLAMYMRGPAEIVPQGMAASGRLEITFHSSEGLDGELADPGGDLGAGRYYDDEPGAPADDLGAPRMGGGRGQSTSLGALLNEQPAISLAGVLPAAGFGSGVGSSIGDGVGSARGLTQEPAGSNRLQGGYARTSVFGAEAQGRHFVYVFDRSGSMDMYHGAPLAAAKSELIGSLKDLEPVHLFGIIFYNEQPRIFNPTGVANRLVFGTDQNKYQAQKFIGSITADGATRHVEALKLALKMAPDAIFFLTDADEPRMTEKELYEIRRINAGTSINTIEFGYGSSQGNENFLMQLARQNGGQHVYVDVARLPGAGR